MFTFLAPTASKKHQPLLPNCQACGLLTKCKSPKQTWNFPPRRGGVIVVNAPDPRHSNLRDGKHEALAKLLARTGHSIHDYAIVPVAACPSPEDDSWKHCQPLMMETIKKLNPEKVLVYGNKSLQSLMTRLWGHSSELTDRFIGTQIPCRELNAWVCPIGWINPKLNPAVSDVWAYRHAKAAAELSGRPYVEVIEYEKLIHTSYNTDEIAAKLNQAGASILSAFDYETTGLKPERPDHEIVTASVAWLQDGKTESVAFPFTEGVRDAWIGYLRSDSMKVAANAKFEMRWSRVKLGVEIRRVVWDTLISSHILDPQEGIGGLKFQAFVSLGQSFYASEVDKYFDSPETGGNGYNRIHDCNMHELLKYNCLDAILELDLALVQMQKAGQGKYWSETLPKKEYYGN